MSIIIKKQTKTITEIHQKFQNSISSFESTYNTSFYISGLSVSNLKCEKDGLVNDLKDIIGNKKKIIMYFESSSCNPCINKTLKALIESGISHSNIIIIGKYYNTKEYKIDSKRRLLNNRIFKIVNTGINKTHPVFIGIIDNDLIIKHAYVINKNDYSKTKIYIRKLNSFLYNENYFFYK